MKLLKFSNFLFKICLLFALIECIIASGSGQPRRGRRGQGNGRRGQQSRGEQERNVLPYLDPSSTGEVPLLNHDVTFQGQIGEGSSVQQWHGWGGLGHHEMGQNVPGHIFQEPNVQGATVVSPSVQIPAQDPSASTPTNSPYSITYQERLPNGRYKQPDIYNFDDLNDVKKFIRPILNNIPYPGPTITYQLVYTHEVIGRSGFEIFNNVDELLNSPSVHLPYPQYSITFRIFYHEGNNIPIICDFTNLQYFKYFVDKV